MLNPISSFGIIFAIFFISYYLNRSYNLNKIAKQSNSLTNKIIMKNTMGTILILFGFLKIVSLHNFVDIFSKYDIITKNFKFYGYVYPFIELGLGYNLLNNISLNKTFISIIIIMSLNLSGTLISIYNKTNLRCGCLGSLFHIPLSYISLSENIFMILMSIYFLL
jgi:hypothetical protein